jgi:hypothetical protein
MKPPRPWVKSAAAAEGHLLVCPFPLCLGSLIILPPCKVMGLSFQARRRRPACRIGAVLLIYIEPTGLHRGFNPHRQFVTGDDRIDQLADLRRRRDAA